MDKTRTYIDKGKAPLFFDLEVKGARVSDQVAAARRGELLELVAGRGTVVVPEGNRGGLEELVRLAGDEEQSFYRELCLDDGSRARACVGFGAVSGCDDTYDCFGLVAEDEGWTAKALEALVQWLTRSGARMARFEVDEPNEAVARLALERGFAEEGRIEGFYRDGVGQRMLMWRPQKERA